MKDTIPGTKRKRISKTELQDGMNMEPRTCSFREQPQALTENIYKRWEKTQYCDLSLLATASKETLENTEFKKMNQVFYCKDNLLEVRLHKIIASQSPQLEAEMQQAQEKTKARVRSSSTANAQNIDRSERLEITLDQAYVEGGALVRCVKFMYTGELDISSSNVTDLLRASHYLGLENAESLCIEFMVQTLNPGNALSLTAIGKMFNCGDLEDKADSFFCNNFSAVAEAEEWNDLRENAVKAILERNDLVCKSEMDIIKAIYKWAIAPSTSEQPSSEDDGITAEEDDVNTRMKTVSNWITSPLVRFVHLSDDELKDVKNGSFMNKQSKTAFENAHKVLQEACTTAIQHEYRHRNDRGYTREIPELRQYEYDRGNQVTKNCCESTLEGHNGYVYTVREVEKGVLASGSRDLTVMIWNLKEKKAIHVLEGHRDRVVKIERFGNKSKERLLASCSFDNTTRIWDPSTDYKCIGVLQGHGNWVVSIAIWMDKIVTGSADNTIKVWNIDSFECERTLRGHYDHVYGLCTVTTSDRDNRSVVYLASGSQDKSIKIWDSTTWSCIQTLHGHIDAVRCVCQFENYLISGSADRIIRRFSLWDTVSWQCVELMTGHTGVIEDLAVLSEPEGNLLVSASRDNSIKIWNVERKYCMKTLRGHRNWVKSLEVTSEGKLVSASADGTLKVWNHRL